MLMVCGVSRAQTRNSRARGPGPWSSPRVDGPEDGDHAHERDGLEHGPRHVFVPEEAVALQEPVPKGPAPRPPLGRRGAPAVEEERLHGAADARHRADEDHLEQPGYVDWWLPISPSSAPRSYIMREAANCIRISAGSKVAVAATALGRA